MLTRPGATAGLQKDQWIDKAAGFLPARLRCRARRLHAPGLVRPSVEEGRNRRNQSNSGKPERPAHAPMRRHLGEFFRKGKEIHVAAQNESRTPQSPPMGAASHSIAADGEMPPFRPARAEGVIARRQFLEVWTVERADQQRNHRRVVDRTDRTAAGRAECAAGEIRRSESGGLPAWTRPGDRVAWKLDPCCGRRAGVLPAHAAGTAVRLAWYAAYLEADCAAEAAANVFLRHGPSPSSPPSLPVPSASVRYSSSAPCSARRCPCRIFPQASTYQSRSACGDRRSRRPSRYARRRRQKP